MDTIRYNIDEMSAWTWLHTYRISC